MLAQKQDYLHNNQVAFWDPSIPIMSCVNVVSETTSQTLHRLFHSLKDNRTIPIQRPYKGKEKQKQSQTLG